MINVFFTSLDNLWLLSPEIVIILMGLLWTAYISLFRSPIGNNHSISLWVSVCILVCSIGFALFPMGDTLLFYDSLSITNTTLIYRWMLDSCALVCLIIVQQDAPFKTRAYDSFFGVYLFALLGLHLMLMVNNWLIFVLSVEIVSIGSYLLAGYSKEEKNSSEAALKYLLLGLVISALLFYGISILYALSGTLSWQTIYPMNGLSLLAMLLILVAIGFKLGFVPAHFWMPDVFEGVPISIACYFSTLPKIASAFLIFRFWNIFETNLQPIVPIVYGVCIATLLLGNLVAMWQTNVKKLLAYSSIGHTGLLLLVVITSNTQKELALTNLSFYLVAYILATLTLFVVLISNPKKITLHDYSGYTKEHPYSAVGVVIACISLIGLPINIGFWGKFYIFSQVLNLYAATPNTIYIGLISIAVLCSVFSLYYYFRWVKNIFLGQYIPEITPPLPRILLISIAILAGLTFGLGFVPQWIR